MKTFIALAGVVVGGVTIIAATILTVWNFTAGLLMLAAAFTVLVFTAWLIRRRDDRDEMAERKAAHANTIRELADTRTECDEVRQALTDLVNKTLALSTDTLPVDEELAQLRRRLQLREVDLENLRAEQRRWLWHYDVCERAQAVAEEDAAKARTR
jgi:archaellum biogenesis protein FlaJ (TadC family)